MFLIYIRTALCRFVFLAYLDGNDFLVFYLRFWVVAEREYVYYHFKDVPSVVLGTSSSNSSTTKMLARTILKLKDKPYLGKPLTHNLKGFSSLPVAGKWGIIYDIDEYQKLVVLRSIGHRKRSTPISLKKPSKSLFGCCFCALLIDSISSSSDKISRVSIIESSFSRSLLILSLSSMSSLRIV